MTEKRMYNAGMVALINSAIERRNDAKRFGKKTYYAYGEYYNLAWAKRVVNEVRGLGFAARGGKGAYIGSFTVYVAKRG